MNRAARRMFNRILANLPSSCSTSSSHESARASAPASNSRAPEPSPPSAHCARSAEAQPCARKLVLHRRLHASSARSCHIYSTQKYNKYSPTYRSYCNRCIYFSVRFGIGKVSVSFRGNVTHRELGVLGDEREASVGRQRRVPRATQRRRASPALARECPAREGAHVLLAPRHL